MIRRIVSLPWKVVKGTYKVAKLASAAVSAALFGAAVYKGIQKVRESQMPPAPLAPIPPAAPVVKAARKKKAIPKAKK